MIAAGANISVVHPLPPDGVDLRAELAAHQRSRIEQALARAAGDLSVAAQLLRVTPLELSRLHPAQGGTAAPAAANDVKPYPVTRQPARPSREERASELSRIERGVELISAAAIRRLSAEGRTPQQIADRLGCNHFTVEKVLRIETERAVRKLRSEGLSPRAIVTRLGLSPSFVDRVLQTELAKCSPDSSRQRWNGV